MQLKYNRQQNIGTSIVKLIIKLILLFIVVIAAIFIIEKISFPSPEQSYKIDITNEIKKLK